MLWTSWVRHFWHFDRIQSTSLFDVHIVRHASSIATIEFEAMRHAQKALKKHMGAHYARTPKNYQKPIFFGRVSTGFHGWNTGFLRVSKSRTFSNMCRKTIFSNCTTGFLQVRTAFLRVPENAAILGTINTMKVVMTDRWSCFLVSWHHIL